MVFAKTSAAIMPMGNVRVLKGRLNVARFRLRVMWHKMATTAGTGTSGEMREEMGESRFQLGPLLYLGNNDADINTLSASGLMTMNCNGVCAGVQCGHGKGGDVELIVIRDKAGQPGGQRAVQVYLGILIMKHVQFEAG